MPTPNSSMNPTQVNFNSPRKFRTTLKSKCKETFFPDDPFRQFKNEKPLGKAKKTLQYFVPIFEWLPQYNLKMFRFDLLAGITITSLAIPQGISYAKLAEIPPIIGLYSSFVPALVYAILGSSKHVAVGTVAACSLLIADTIGSKVSSKDDPTLYLHLVFTAAFITGVFQAALGFLRLGILVDFLSHSTITGFMGGTAIIICLQQLKGLLGVSHFTTKTDVVSVLHAVFKNRNEWKWETAVVGMAFLVFLLFTRYLRQRKPKLFWVSAMAPMVVVVLGCLLAYFTRDSKYSIQTVGKLHKGLNPISIEYLNFDAEYLPYTLKAGIITGIIALAEGIAIGRSFAIMNNEQVDGNKEMIAFGFMNIVGSCFSCYLTTGPFSKTAVNYNSGCKTAASNLVMAIGMMLTLLFLAPLFSYTPLVALSAIIMSAMLGLIKYEEAYHLFKVALALLRALLYVARPAACKLGKLPDSTLYRDTEQYAEASGPPGILAIQLGSPIYYANGNYIRERILRWIRNDEGNGKAVKHVLLDLTGVTSIDTTGIETLAEVLRILEVKHIKMKIVNPRLDVLEKMMKSKFVDKIGKESIFLCMEDAVEASYDFSATTEKQGFEEQRSGVA
ncbi:probable sulfate transporter 3.5 isoform X2 [Populus trichocarpa]|uniref:probable sulfate transporter 3.5 isoform X2 n=1 Tax=Populus trichocarpa TaxID=3694 RepID=UPI0022780B79|nr:probable sulfate transporter 3.5 isoform X2 [Populus trichocarpa]